MVLEKGLHLFDEEFQLYQREVVAFEVTCVACDLLYFAFYVVDSFLKIKLVLIYSILSYAVSELAFHPSTIYKRKISLFITEMFSVGMEPKAYSAESRVTRTTNCEGCK